MASAMGILRWTPEVFWKSTAYEYSLAIKGYLIAKGVKTEGPMTRSEFLELQREDDKRKRGN